MLRIIPLILLLAACAPVEQAAPRAPQGSELYLGSGVTYVTHDDGTRSIALSGRIEFETDDVLAAALARDPSIGTVMLFRSDGGYVQEAMTIGRMIRARGMTTVAAGYCASACVDVFIAGRYRAAVDGTYFGLHAPSDTGEVQMAIDARYYTMMGVPQMFSMTYSVDHEDMRWINAHTAQAYNIVDAVLE